MQCPDHGAVSQNLKQRENREINSSATVVTFEGDIFTTLGTVNLKVKCHLKSTHHNLEFLNVDIQ